MRDFAHEWTDEEIRKLQRKFARVYRQAAREMRQKLDDYLAEFDKANKEWKEALKAGDVTKKQYKEWLRVQSMRREYLVDMSETLAYDAAHTNRLAADMINDALPRVYAENANYAAYGIESHYGKTHMFDMYDQDTIRRIMGMSEDDQIIHEVIPYGPVPPDKMLLQSVRVRPDLVKDVAWNRQKFTSSIVQSILQGESIPNTAKRLETVLNMDRRMATRAARTAMTSAENAGRTDSYRRAKALGIELQQEWLATTDERTRVTHRLLDGQHVQVGGSFRPDGYGPEYSIRFPGDPEARGDMTWNCFIGETLVTTDSQIKASYRHEYVGELITVDTSSGIHFTCTPNHPILTPRGWVAAKFLNDGDNLLITGRSGAKRSFWKPNVNHAFASMEAVHELFDVLFAKRATVTGVDFHGDIATSDVEVVAKKGFLGFRLDSSIFKRISKLALKPSDTLDFCGGTTMKRLGRIVVAASRIMSRLGVCAPLIWGHGSHSDVHGLRATTGCNPSVAEYAIDNLPAETMVRSELLSRLSRQVFVDKVVNVKISSTRGTQVYNLQTDSGYYFANEKDNGKFIIAKNCRCTLVAWFPEDGEESAKGRFSRLPEGMTYEQWKAMKEDERKNEVINDGNPETLAGVKRGSPMTFDEANELRGNPNYNMASSRYNELLKARKRYNEAIDRYGFSSQEFLDANKALDDAQRAYENAQREQNGYQINCQTCVVANEARRRGYDVEAMPNTNARGSVSRRLARNTSLAWIDPKTGKHPRYIRYDGEGRADSLGNPIPTHARFMKWLDSDGTVEEGARYTIEFWWKGRNSGGHILCLERTEQGLRMYDPQGGDMYTGDEISKYLANVKYKTTSLGSTYADAPMLLKVSDYDFDIDICEQILREARHDS